MYRSIAKYTLLFYLTLALLAGRGWANDASEEVANPRPQLIGPVNFTVSKLAINISLPSGRPERPKDKNLEVSYILTRGNGGLVSSTVEFMIQSYGNYGVDWWYPDRSFQELEIWINGGKAERGQNSHAMFGSRDITSALTAYGLSPNFIGNEHGLIGNVENVQRYAELIDKEYLWLADFGNKEPRLMPKWYASNRYWVSFESKAGDTINFTYKHSLLPASYPISLRAKSNEELHSRDVISTLKSLRLTPEGIGRLLGGSGESDYANISWSIIPISNLVQGRQIGSLTVKVTSAPSHSAEAAQKLVFVMLDSEHIYSAFGSIKVELKDYRITNGILIVVLERM